MDEQEFKDWLKHAGLIWVTALLGIYVSFQLSAEPLIQAAFNAGLTILVAPFFLHLLSILVHSSPVVLWFPGRPLLWFSIFCMRIVCLIDDLLNLIPRNPYGAQWRYHRLELAYILHEAAKSLTAEKIVRSLIESIEKKDHQGLVLLRSMKLQGEILESLEFFVEAEKVWLKTLDYLNNNDDKCKFNFGIMTHEIRLGNMYNKGLVLTNLGNLYLKQGRFDLAINHLKKAIWAIKDDDVTREDPANIALVDALCYLVLAYKTSRNYREMLFTAKELHDLTAPLSKDKAGWYYICALWMIAEANLKLKRYDEGIEVAEEAKSVAMSPAIIGDTTIDPLRAGILKTIASIRRVKHDLPAALDSINQSDAIRKKMSDTTDPWLCVPDILIELSHVYRDMKEDDKAERHLLLALECAEWTFGFTHPSVGVIARELERYYRDKNEDDFEKFFERRAVQIEHFAANWKPLPEPYSELIDSRLFWSELDSPTALSVSTSIIWLSSLFVFRDAVTQYPLVASLFSAIVLLHVLPFFLYRFGTYSMLPFACVFTGDKHPRWKKFLASIVVFQLQIVAALDRLILLIPANPYAIEAIVHNYGYASFLCMLDRVDRRKLQAIVRDMGRSTTSEPIMVIALAANLSRNSSPGMLSKKPMNWQVRRWRG